MTLRRPFLHSPFLGSPFLNSQIIIIDGLAWDWINQVLYWTDYCEDEIGVYDVSSHQRAVLINTGLIEPRDIVIDPRSR